MKYKIIVDSSSNLDNTFLEGTDIGFDVAPLKVTIGEKTYVDDGSADINEMLERNHDPKLKATSSCPNPNDFLSKMEGADYYILITITSKLSGSYNAACAAKMTYTKPENVIVLDSLSCCGGLELLTRKAVELIKSDTPFEKIEEALTIYRDEDVNLLFVLDKFDTFVKSGRVNKVVAFIAGKLNIKTICMAKNGNIGIKENVRTMKVALEKMVTNIGKLTKSTLDKICIISHTNNLEAANQIKDNIAKQYQFKEILIRENKALCSYYAMEKAVHIAF